MIVTIIKDSVIYNGIIYKIGDAVEITDSIAESLIERGYVSEAATDTPDEEGETAQPISRETELEEASYTELKKLAASMGLSANGKKPELIARIIAAENGEDEAEAEEIAGDLPNTSMPD